MSAIRDDVAAGRPLRVVYIDAHGHFGTWMRTTIPWATDGGRLVAEMDRCGCDQVWMSASSPGYGGDVAAANDRVFDLAEAHAGRVVPYCTLSANAQAQAEAEPRRCLARGPCVGVKMHRYNQPRYSLRADWLQPVLERLAEARAVYLNHGFEDLDALLWATQKYPQVTFVSGHFAPHINDLAAARPNLLDCTCAALTPGSVEAEVRRLGRSETMLLGSDFGLFHLGFGLGMVAYADLDEGDKENLIGRNALRILRRMAWFDEASFGKPAGRRPSRGVRSC